MNEDIKHKLIQFIKFGLVGLTNNVVYYIVNIAILFAISDLKYEYDYIVANSIAFIVSVFWSYFLNSKFVFKKSEDETRNTWLTLIKTFACYSITGLVLNNILLIVWVQCLGISKLIAPVINLFISVPINFLLNKFWAFKGKKNDTSNE
ncbi:MAG: GtrA family protein [Treponema sp.]|nr:GtrA family protein [Spirochaetia bacterium]MDY4210486.1 GtrA family protein [Treponema sp.]